jgi:hypothetical protein
MVNPVDLISAQELPEVDPLSKAISDLHVTHTAKATEVKRNDKLQPPTAVAAVGPYQALGVHGPVTTEAKKPGLAVVDPKALPAAVSSIAFNGLLPSDLVPCCTV